MKNTHKYLAFGLTIAGTITLMALLTFALLLSSVPTNAAPPAAPTPVADIVTGGDGKFFNFQPLTALTADTNAGGTADMLAFDSVDVQYTIDHGTVNTTTIKVQYSNDGTTWNDGLTLVSASAADGSGITRVPVFGRYLRLNQDVTSADPITITLTGVGR